MGKLKGITSGTYLTKRIRNEKHKKFSKEEICNKCQHKGVCKYQKISKFINGKIFQNNVECNEFYFTITPKAILTIGRDTTTGKILTKTFIGKNEEEAISKALSEKIKIEQNGGIKIITKTNKTISYLVRNVIDEDYKPGKIKKPLEKGNQIL